MIYSENLYKVFFQRIITLISPTKSYGNRPQYKLNEIENSTKEVQSESLGKIFMTEFKNFPQLLNHQPKENLCHLLNLSMKFLWNAYWAWWPRKQSGEFEKEKLNADFLPLILLGFDTSWNSSWKYQVPINNYASQQE